MKGIAFTVAVAMFVVSLSPGCRRLRSISMTAAQKGLYDDDHNCNGYDESVQYRKSHHMLQPISFRLSIFNVFYAMAHPLYYVLATYDVFFAVPSEET